MTGNKNVSLCKNIPLINKLYHNQPTDVYIHFIHDDCVDLPALLAWNDNENGSVLKQQRGLVGVLPQTQVRDEIRSRRTRAIACAHMYLIDQCRSFYDVILQPSALGPQSVPTGLASLK